MKKKIIVAPLNWGLGHASRCVPIINALLQNNFTPILASDGEALLFLQKEFPHLQSITLPDYTIKYSKFLKLSLLFQAPKVWKTLRKEKKVIAKFIKTNKEVVGIISDNRFGVYHNSIPSVYITHQLNVFSGITTFFTSKVHQEIIKNFDECWIPDTNNSQLSGNLSKVSKKLNRKFIGVLSRFKKVEVKEDIDILILISGPEPNRTLFKERMLSTFNHTSKKIVFVLGKVEKKKKKWKEKSITIYNYLLKDDLEKLILRSKVVVCRSGYSSIMDLAVLQKKAFFIPTKSQYEQEYLAKYLCKMKIAPYCALKDFTEKKLEEVKNYKGLTSKETEIKKELFSLFNGK